MGILERNDVTQATICIPSHRPLETSLEPLWSAITYAEARGMKVVISDNSGDPIKRDYFAAAPAHVTYLGDGPDDAAANVLSALSAVTTDFVLLLGDDDFMDAAGDAPAFDFASLAADVVGVKPRIEIWTRDKGVTEVNDFTLDAIDPAQRVLEYARKMRGANSSYYSFFRTAEIVQI